MSSGPLPQRSWKVVPWAAVIGDQLEPSQWKIDPDEPTAYTSADPVPQTPLSDWVDPEVMLDQLVPFQ